MASGHARVKYALDFDGRIVFALVRGNLNDRIVHTTVEEFEPEPAAALPPYKYYFGSPLKALPGQPAIDALAMAMMDPARPEGGDSEIPAGYTYLGQFLFHDISWLRVEGNEKANHASSALDLDSVLGRNLIAGEPSTGCPLVLGPLRAGLTANGWAGEQPRPDDLPRKPRCGAVTSDDSNPAGFPLIPDRRNEGFLQLAQLHLLFIKFYNAVANSFGFGTAGFDETSAKRSFIQHVQAIALYDFLPRVIDPDVYNDIIGSGSRRAIRPEGITPTTPYLIPLEFAAAAGRYGHSMIRADYDWNLDHQQATAASLEELLEQTYQNARPGSAKLQKLPYDWVVAWRRLFDLRPLLGTAAGAPGMAKKIDTHLTAFLSMLPEYIREVPAGVTPPPPNATFNLARETLSRQIQFQMASAQQIIQRINTIAGATIVTELTPAEWNAGNDPAIDTALSAHPELTTATPIWFYILKEAERRGVCGRLGPLGSRLVMETLHAAIEASAVSILRVENWSPALPRLHADRFTMPDLIAFST
ncbi:heme peroxidase family protein [soil metagenome]